MTTATKFPTLYKQTNTGKIQQWSVSTDNNSVTTIYGQVGGKLQTITDTIRVGKNLGKSNETTPVTQAELQAQQEYDAKLKEGYSPSFFVAETNKNILGAVEVMLAFPIEKKEKYVTFPAIAQPKLDGLRCVAIIKGGKARLFSRTQKEYKTVPHIVEELEGIFEGEDIILDGEIYSHAFKDDFNSITHLAKRDGVHEDSKKLEYHVYDTVTAGGYRERMEKGDKFGLAEYCTWVETITVTSRQELEEYQAKCVEKGYEGCMLRSIDGEYEGKRSPNLLKVKTFIDDEFQVLGMEEGKGKLMGAVGAFVMQTEGGVGFKAKPMGTLAQSQKWWVDRKSLIGKWGTVKYQGKTPDGSLRFPIFKAFRDEKE